MTSIPRYFRKFSLLLFLELFFLLLLWFPVFLEFSTILNLSNALPSYLWHSLSPFFTATIYTVDFKLYIALYLICLWIFVTLFNYRMEGRKLDSHPIFMLLFLMYLFSLTWTFLVFPHYISIPAYLSIPVFLIYFRGCHGVLLPEDKILNFLIGTGIIIGFIAFFQYFQVSWGILEITDDYRRNVGTTLGHNTSTSFILYHTLLLIVFLKHKSLKYFYPIIFLLIFGILVAQSRSTFLQIAVNSLLALYIFRSRIRDIIKKPITKTGIVIIVLLIVSQSFQNPLLLSRKSLTRRLYDFSPAVVMRGTRVRIARISLDMIKDQPFAGMGINSFRYYYPYYQGQYFKDHTHTILVPSDRKSDSAHNDLLQLALETGIPIAVMILALYLFLLVKIFRNKQWMEGFFLVNFLIQALVDFPFRLPFITVYILFFVALAWKQAFLPFKQEEVRKGVVYLFVFCFGMIFSLMLPFYWNLFYNSQAQKYLRLIRSSPGFLSPSQQNLMLERAEDNMERAIRYNYFDVDSRYYAGIIALQQTDGKTAKHHFDMGLIEGSNHFLHFYLGQIYYRQGLLEKARSELAWSIYKSPNFRPALFMQLRVLSLLEETDPMFLRYYRQYTGEEGYKRLMEWSFELLEASSYRELSFLQSMGRQLYPDDKNIVLMKYTSALAFEKEYPQYTREARQYADTIRAKDNLSWEERLYLWYVDGEYEKITPQTDQEGYYLRFLRILIEQFHMSTPNPH